MALSIPAQARRVGLVGAAVTDHPALPEILRALVDAGREVGVSSLRADRLDHELVRLLARGGWVEYRLAQAGFAEGLAPAQAAHAGGSFAAWKRALGG